MELIGHLYQGHPFWVWMSLGAALLAVEVMTGSGYLLWPAASAGVVALLTGARLGLPAEILVFAALTIASTLLSRRYLPHPFRPKGPDINDPRQRIVGHHGHAVAEFISGRGRVLVEGKEWAAELEGGGALTAGADVEVTRVVSGSRLMVRLPRTA